MAQVPEGGGGGGRHEKKRAKKSSTHIDMTPMVDLAFLLLTFFILTTTMYRPSSLQMTFPVPDPDAEKNETKLNNAITLLLTGNDEIYYYFGEFVALAGGEKPPTTLEKTDFSQVQKILVERNKETVTQMNELAKQYNDKKLTEEEYTAKRRELKSKPDNLKAIIKTDADAKYRNMIDMVDEMDISGIGSYGVMDSLKVGELQLLNATKGTL